MATSSNRSTVAIVAAAVAVIAVMVVYRVVTDSEQAVPLETLPPMPSTTAATTTTSSTTTTTTTLASPPVVPVPVPVLPDEDEDSITTTTIDREPVRDGRDQWGNQRYVDPVTRELVYLLDARGERIELDDYEALRWWFFDRAGNWVFAAQVLRPR